MKTLHRYIALEALKLFIMGEGAFTGIYLFVAFFDKLDDYIEHSAAAPDVAAYMLLKIPSILLDVTPAAILLSSTLTLALLSKHNELMAMKAAGISIFEIFKPLLLAALSASALMFFTQEFVAPAANTAMKDIYRVKVEKKPPAASTSMTDIWYRAGKSQIWNVRYLDGAATALKGATIYIFGEDKSLVKRIDAERALWNGTGWMLEKGVARDFNPDGSFSEVSFDELFFAPGIKPGELKEMQKDPAEMNLWELNRYRKKLRRGGFDDKTYLLEMHFKISRPAIPLLMAFIAIPFAAARRVKGGLAQGFGFTVAVSFIYYVLMSLGLALGKAGSLPAPLAAWEANIIFASASIYFLLGSRERT